MRLSQAARQRLQRAEEVCKWGVWVAGQVGEDRELVSWRRRLHLGGPDTSL